MRASARASNMAACCRLSACDATSRSNWEEMKALGEHDTTPGVLAPPGVGHTREHEQGPKRRNLRAEFFGTGDERLEFGVRAALVREPRGNVAQGPIARRSDGRQPQWAELDHVFDGQGGARPRVRLEVDMTTTLGTAGPCIEACDTRGAEHVVHSPTAITALAPQAARSTFRARAAPHAARVSPPRMVSTSPVM
jgi:hypothetical protein